MKHLLLLAIVVAVAIAKPRHVGEEAVKTVSAGPLLIGAFNIQIFGVSKMDNPEVVANLVLILNRYDLVLIQEIRDASQTAIYELLDECNAANNDPFSITMSMRLGRTSSTEQYAFFYRASKMSIARTFQWDEQRIDDVFERPPYVVEFNTFDTALGTFGYIPLHAKPEDAVAEDDALVDVYDGMVSMWGHENFLIGGDLNAACSYVGDADWVNIRLRTDPRFMWVIGDEVNTRTRTDYVCAYDRLVLAGSTLQGAYVGGSAVAYRFDVDLNLNEQKALEVSDHVPVEMTCN